MGMSNETGKRIALAWGAFVALGFVIALTIWLVTRPSDSERREASAAIANVVPR